MSASLVGSEMCIRDRRCVLLGAEGSPWPFMRGVGCATLSDRVEEIGAIPVSYTHLTLPTICSV
eukprot:79229-Alexandrium_andersonii.AAC.1